MSEIRTTSTSRDTAQTDDVVIRQTDTVRLVFRPTIVENQSNSDAAVRGVFLYQRKSRNAEWHDFETIPLTSVKSGEGYKLQLRSEELLKLFRELRSLYKLKEEQGVPRGEKRFAQLTPQLDQLRQLERQDVTSVLNANRQLGGALLSKLTTWAANLDDPSPIIDKLLELEPGSIAKLNAALGLSRIRAALACWQENETNSDEEFWQRILTERSFVLEQIFAWPISIVQGKAYVGGKSVYNTRGNLVDFLVRNRLTRSAALIEIKTPRTPLLGNQYRQTYNVSTELSGSIMQALNYKHSLQDNYQALSRGNQDLFDSLDPQCAVIIGDTRQLDDASKTKAFELYRHQFPGLAVIPFDELFDRTRHLMQLLEDEPVAESTEFDDDIPF